MRKGINPNSNAQAQGKIQDVVLACLTHLPNQYGYHERRLEIVQNCLETMRAGARRNHTMAIWDNGSGPALRDWLQNVFKPDILILSENVGKATARTSLFRMFHPDSIVAFSDDDMLFYDNWLNPQIELLQQFPNVACVSGYPVRTSFRWGNKNTLQWAASIGILEKGNFIPDEWERDFCVSIGRDYVAHRLSVPNNDDYRVTYKGLQALCTSHHCQFIGRAGVIGSVLHYDGLAMGAEREFDVALDTFGLRLATTKRLARHIGNVIHPELREEIRKKIYAEISS